MDLHLTDDDVTLLQEILDSAFRDLRFEVGDTDNHEYKQELKQREAAIKALLDQVGGPIPQS